MLIAPNVTIHEGEASHNESTESPSQSAGDFVSNFSKNLTDTNRTVRGQSGSESPKASSCRIPITRVNSNSSAFKFQFKKRGRARAMTDPQPTSSSRPPKRRIRTFYSKKWGNKLFGLTSQTSPSPMSAPVTSRVTPCKPPPFPLNPTHIDIAATVDAVRERERCHERDATAQSLISLSGMELWRSSLCSMRSPSPSPVHVGGVSSVDIEEVDVDANADCSQNLNAAHLGVATDFRFAENGTYAYDSATSMVSMVSMLAANTDADDEGGDDDDNDEDNEAEMVQMVESVENCKRRSAFKIVVSEPMEHHHFEGGHQSGHSEEEQRARNVFNSRMTSKRNKRRLCKRYIASDYDDSDCGGSSADCSSSDDCVTDDDCVREHSPMMRAHSVSEQRQQGQGLYLCGNDLNVGVYSSFCFENDRESDLLSEISGQSDSDCGYGDVSDGAQSDDSAFDELTICYGRGRNFRNAKNIRFRGDLGPSDIGSSDTECCYGSSDTEQPLSAGQ